ncbi:MAG: sialidase family protein, partial [Planctomycetaceae bacterium]
MKRNPVSGSPLCLLLGLLICSLNAGHAMAQDFIEVRSPRTLSVDKISCQRIPLGEVEDYKPTIVLLPSDELVLSMFTGRRLENGKIAEQAILYRSADGGLTWSKRELPDIAGREPALSVTKDGTLFITAHLLGQDVRNKDGYTHSYLHRSKDRGQSWTSRRVEPEEFRPRTVGLTTRNVLQLADGSLILGISEHAPNCRSVMLRSTNGGQTWPETYQSHFSDVPEDYPYTLFGEAHLWQARSGKLY